MNHASAVLVTLVASSSLLFEVQPAHATPDPDSRESPSFGAERSGYWEVGGVGWLGGVWPEGDAESVGVHGGTVYASWRSAPRRSESGSGGDILEALGEIFAEALELAIVGNQWGVELRGHHLQGDDGPWYGVGLGLVTSAVMPDNAPAYLPRFGGILGFLVPEVGILTNGGGERAFHGRLMMPIAVPLSRALALDLRVTVLGFTQGPEGSPDDYFGFGLGMTYRGGVVK